MKPLRVLIVEDDSMIGMLLGEMLEGMGHEVCAIEATEADAVASALRCDPGMMIVDARLGDGSGLSAVRTIVRSRPVPHVFVSGDISRIQALRPGAVVLQKPFYELQLAQAMKQALKANLTI